MYRKYPDEINLILLTWGHDRRQAGDGCGGTEAVAVLCGPCRWATPGETIPGILGC